jgi:SPX domain protein involved in polyphosphate accumulation
MNRLKSVLHLDAHSPIDGYKVRSLYFEDIYNSSYNDKITGVYAREKVRLRYYGIRPDTIKLERKIKKGLYITKDVSVLGSAEVLALIGPDQVYPEALIPAYHNVRLKPKLIIEYQRTALVYEPLDVRITFDTHLKYSSQIYLYFDDDFPMHRLMPSNQVIMEIKYK